MPAISTKGKVSEESLEKLSKSKTKSTNNRPTNYKDVNDKDCGFSLPPDSEEKARERESSFGGGCFPGPREGDNESTQVNMEEVERPSSSRNPKPETRDDESTRSSEDGLDEALKKAQRDSEKAARKAELELRKKAQEEADRLSREEMLDKLRKTMKKSSAYADFLFTKLKAAPDPKETKRGRKRKSSTLPSKGKRTRLSVAGGAGKEKEGEVREDKENEEMESESPAHPEAPLLFTGGTLRDYQLVGVKWLSSLHYNGINGILADEMGLGKTVQVIAELCLLFEQGIQGPFLILAPLSTVSNWQAEFTRFAPKIPVIVYHGTPQERQALQREMTKRSVHGNEMSYPVFITTYEIVLRDVSFFKRPRGGGPDNDVKTDSWSYFVIDEGHRMKNYRACLTRTLKELKLEHRLILTGTPLQNDLSELWSLLNFILPEVFNNRDWFQSFFDFSWIGDEGRAEMEAMGLVKIIHEILNPFLLRRIKKDVELSLPPKREVMVYAPLTPWQRDIYEAALGGRVREYFGIFDQSQKAAVVQSTKRSRKDVTYESFFRDDSDDSEEKFMETLAYEQTWKSEIRKPNMDNENKIFLVPKTGEKCLLNTKVMNNTAMLLREITMHPYLVCRPVVETERGMEEKEPTLPDLVKQSGKMMVLDTLLVALKERGHKVLLFSQFTGMLDYIQDYCCLKKYNFRRLDGSCHLDVRKEGIWEFNEDPDVFIYLISTKAGGLGINLTGADTVIFFDSDWNPQTDIQAQDRCHRIGQTKPVVIYRLTGKGTIDEKIMERATNKRRLEKMVIFEKSFKGMEHDPKDVDVEELLGLVRSTDYSQTLEAAESGAVISDADMEKLMDRSDKAMEADKKQASDGAFQVIA